MTGHSPVGARHAGEGQGLLQVESVAIIVGQRAEAPQASGEGSAGGAVVSGRGGRDGEVGEDDLALTGSQEASGQNGGLGSRRADDATREVADCHEHWAGGGIDVGDAEAVVPAGTS